MSDSAIVIGGGICGLLTAHALGKIGLQVTLVERGTYPVMPVTEAPPARVGVPQSHCLHMLMSGGAAVFDQFVPGWRDQLAANGAVPFDAIADAATRFPSGWVPRLASGLTMYACSRSLLERTLLDMLAPLPNVAILSNASVDALLHDPDQNRVIGVRTRDQDITAGVVVDASGTASHMSKWLAALPGRNGPQPEETVVPSPWQYISQWWRFPPARTPDWTCLSIAPDPNRPTQAGMMLRAERNCWNVVLLAGSNQSTPSTTGALLNFAADVGEGELAKALALGEPITSVHAYGRTANRFRHWGRMTDLPDGLAILGDAAMTLDPYRGLGMTTASIGVKLLYEMLSARDLRRFRTCIFQRELAHLQEWPWRIVTGHDADGCRDDRLLSELARLYELAPAHAEIARAVYECHHLVRPPEHLPEGVAQ